MHMHNSVRWMFMNVIMMNDPNSVVRAVTMDPMHWFIDVPNVSMSLVTRLITSPLDERSKYDTGMRSIFLETSLRNICAERWETVAMR